MSAKQPTNREIWVGVITGTLAGVIAAAIFPPSVVIIIGLLWWWLATKNDKQPEVDPTREPRGVDDLPTGPILS